MNFKIFTRRESIKKSIFYFITILLVCFHPLLFASEVEQIRDNDSGLFSWKVKHQGFQLELTQLLPDYIRAIYRSHGFPSEAIEDIANDCIFGTIVRNNSDASLFYNLADWYAMASDGEKQKFKLKAQWLEEWKKLGIHTSWTILPSEQTFDSGDWSQGFTTINLPRNEPFDLIYSWKLEGTKHLGTIKNMRCAPINLQNE